MVNFVTSSARLMFITFVILYLIQVRSVVGCLGEEATLNVEVEWNGAKM